MGNTRYKPPTLQELYELPIKLERSYKEKKEQTKKEKNEQRLATLNMLSQLTNHAKRSFEDQTFREKISKSTRTCINEEDISVGMAICELELIKSEYGSSDPIKSVGYFWNTGSEMYTDIWKGLNINPKNNLTDEDRFVYLYKLYHYVENYFPAENINGPVWQNKQNFLKKIEYAMIQVRNRESAQITKLISGMPELHVLLARSKQIPGQYTDAIKSDWFTNARRLEQLTFFIFITDACEKIPPGNKEEVIDALYIFLCLDIGTEYTKLSPERSRFYRMLEKGIHLDKRTIQEKIDYLTSLSRYFNYVKSDPLYKGNKIIDEFAEINERIDQMRFELEVEKKRKPAAARYVGTVVNYGTQVTVSYGVSFAAVNIIKEYALGYILQLLGGGSIGAAVASGSIFGPAGVLSVTGTIFLVQIARLIAGNAISDAVGIFWTWALQRTCEKIGDTASDALLYALNKGKDGLKGLLTDEKILTPEDRKFLKEWIESLLEAPDSVIKKEIKKELITQLGRDIKPENDPIVRIGDEMNALPKVTRL